MPHERGGLEALLARRVPVDLRGQASCVVTHARLVVRRRRNVSPPREMHLSGATRYPVRIVRTGRTADAVG